MAIFSDVQPLPSNVAHVEAGPPVDVWFLAAQISKPAALVSHSGVVRHLNDAAKALAHSWPQLGEGRSLWPQNPERRNKHGARRGDLPSSLSCMCPIVLSSEVTDSILFAQPLCRLAHGHQPEFLVLISAFTAGRLADLTVLLVLGLTPAEARLSVLIASGLTIADAADELHITPSTARSTLKLVYSKLGIRKQSEVARLVSFVQALTV